MAQEDNSILAKVSKNINVITLFEKSRIRNSFWHFFIVFTFYTKKKSN